MNRLVEYTDLVGEPESDLQYYFRATMKRWQFSGTSANLKELIFVCKTITLKKLKTRKLLWDSSKADRDRDSGKKATLVHDKLRIDGDVFVWGDVKNDCKLIKKKTVVQPAS